MPINPQFVVAAVDLSEVFVDKDTGAPLSGGIVSFFQDSDHITPKIVYTIQNNNPALPPVYTYVPLPNPITLSGSGQFQDNNGNNIPVYYYPVDANGVEQLYYITVTNATGVQQFIRQAWPPNENGAFPAPGVVGSLSNQITDPQFIDVNFVPSLGITFNYVGNSIDTIAIAPDWNLVISHTGNGTLTVARTAVQGSSAYPNNPPYTITVTPGVNIASLQLIQTFQNNPDVFSPSLIGINGYISASILLAPASVATVSYQPNGQVAQLILNANNITGNYATFSNTVQLTPAANPSTGDTGSTAIIVGLSTAVPTTFSNIQIIPLNSNIQNIPYDQRTANRDRDFEFNYYNSQLKAKPIPSYLIGWDFPLNPTQVSGNGTIAAQATGGGAGSFQAWDQTVVFQSVTNGVTIARSASGNGAMTVTANQAAVQFALIQYLPKSIAREILQNPLSSQLTALTNRVAGLGGTISLWYTTNGTLPSTAANHSLVTTLDANGHPSAVVAGWSEVPRGNLGNAQFTVGTSANANLNDYGFSFWNLNGSAAINTANFFAIVVGFSSFSNATPDTIDIGSVSLVPGNIPTRPAPQKLSEVLLECQSIYESSFPIGVAPAQATGVLTAFWGHVTLNAGMAPQNLTFNIPFKVTKYTAPTSANITFLNPVNANALIYNITSGMDYLTTAIANNGGGNNVSPYGFAVMGTQAAGTQGDFVAINWICDLRFGL